MNYLLIIFLLITQANAFDLEIKPNKNQEIIKTKFLCFEALGENSFILNQEKSYELLEVSENIFDLSENLIQDIECAKHILLVNTRDRDNYVRSYTAQLSETKLRQFKNVKALYLRNTNSSVAVKKDTIILKAIYGVHKGAKVILNIFACMLSRGGCSIP